MPNINHTFKNKVVQLVSGGAAAGLDDNKDIKVKKADGWVINNTQQHFVLVQVDGDTVTTKAYEVYCNGESHQCSAASKPFDCVTKNGTSVTIGCK